MGKTRLPIGPLALCGAIAVPAIVLRVTGAEPTPVLALVAYGAAVVAASFLLAWAAEAARVDISGPLAIAILALIAVLPEYAVDLYFAYAAGSQPEFVSYAAANMTGSNRLLLGLGWPLVVLIALYVARRRTAASARAEAVATRSVEPEGVSIGTGRKKRRGGRALSLAADHRIELGFLAIAGAVAFVVPVSGQIHLVFGMALLAFFGFYLWKVSRAEAEEVELAGPAARIGTQPKRLRRPLVIGLFVFSAAVILAAAEPFAGALIGTGTQLGIDRFLLVQWLAPLASEAPEFIVAALFAARGMGAAAIGTLISAKVNQWTLLVGSLPVAYLAGGGTAALPLDGRQQEEFLLTATQTALGVCALLALRFPRWAAWTLLALFAVQFAVPHPAARLVLCGVYAALALAALIHNRRWVVATVTAPFRRMAFPATDESGTESSDATGSQSATESGVKSDGEYDGRSSGESVPTTVERADARS